MLKRTIPILVALAVFLAACGPQATPTMNPADVQGTAVAAAWTVVAETQAALPTSTPVPPTETSSPTSLPTFTPLPPSTLSVTLPAATATQAAASNPDTCLKPLDTAAAGPTVRMRVDNESGGTIFSLSLNLYEKNAFGECGALTITNIPKNGSATIDLPRGKWWGYAWINYAGGTSSTSSGSWELRVGDEDKLRILVDKDVITVKP